AALFPKRLVHGWTPKGTRPRLATAFVRRSTAMIEAVNLVLNGPDHGERKLKSLLSQPDDLLFEAVDVGEHSAEALGTANVIAVPTNITASTTAIILMVNNSWRQAPTEADC